MKARIALLLALVVCAAQAVAIVYLVQRDGWRRAAADTPVARGRAVAERAGCFACHGPGGTSPVANPGAKYGEVPGWGGGTWMLWNDDESDVRAWIEDGHPPGRTRDDGALIPMPAYRDVLDPGETDDLVAYVLAVSHFGRIEEPAAKEGRDLAVRLGCFGCHGAEGRGLIANPGSFKGYIPAWDGDDYAELVRDAGEFRQWVENGISDRLRDNAVARRFLEAAAIRMPAYGDLLDDEQVAALHAYVEWARRNPRGRVAGSPAAR